jgi:hypothetical protein
MNDKPKSPLDPKRKQEKPVFKPGKLSKNDSIVMWLIMLGMAAVFGTFIWEMNRHPSWGPKLNTLLTAHRYWHSFDFEELMFLAVGGLIMLLMIFLWISGYLADRREKQEQKAGAGWNHSLAPLVDIDDYDDRECLYEDLDPAERSRLFAALRHMPKGSRSLRKALEIVNPEWLHDSET